ncbi:fimbrial assembly family protein [Pseudomonas sp. M47T1]|nr:fimbrial assembly family protein [Pseudomonas sp. M47T1]
MPLAHLRQAHGRWQISQPRRWLHLWLAELHGLLPAAVRARLASGPTVQTLPWPLPEDIDGDRPVQLLLPSHEVLAPRITLPLAATRDLQRVLAFELDKYTPLPADQVHFTARIERQGASTASVRLVAICRERLALMLEHCQASGARLQAIDALDVDGKPLGVDLLPAHLRPAPSTAARLNRRLALAAAALLVAVMAMALHSRAATVANMRADVAAQRQQVQALEALRHELTDTQGAARYLAGLKTARPTLTRLVSELGQCLGADTWLEQLEVRDSGELILTGQSRHASALISRSHDCASLRDVRFQGIIQPDADTGLDRFALAARLTQEAADAPPPDRP